MLRHGVSVVEVAAKLFSLVTVHDFWVCRVNFHGDREEAVDDNIGVATDGGGEVGVDFRSQTIMTKVLLRNSA